MGWAECYSPLLLRENERQERAGEKVEADTLERKCRVVLL